MIQKIDEKFSSLVLSYEQPENSDLSLYNYLIQPTISTNGALNQRLIFVKKDKPFGDLLCEFFNYSNGLDVFIENKYIVFSVAAIFVIKFNLDIYQYPDECQDILNLIEQTPKGNKLKDDVILKINSHPNGEKILEKLQTDKLIQYRNGKYIILRNPNLNIGINLCK